MGKLFLERIDDPHTEKGGILLEVFRIEGFTPALVGHNHHQGIPKGNLMRKGEGGVREEQYFLFK
jgi:hypothetical protein